MLLVAHLVRTHRSKKKITDQENSQHEYSDRHKETISLQCKHHNRYHDTHDRSRISLPPLDKREIFGNNIDMFRYNGKLFSENVSNFTQAQHNFRDRCSSWCLYSDRFTRTQRAT